jgi:hypothetical protein
VYGAADGPEGTIQSNRSPRRLIGISRQKVSAGYLTYPADVRDTVKNGMGRVGNRHLNSLVESISVNVGGSCRDVKASRPPLPGVSVGGVIVV